MYVLRRTPVKAKIWATSPSKGDTVVKQILAIAAMTAALATPALAQNQKTTGWPAAMTVTIDGVKCLRIDVSAPRALCPGVGLVAVDACYAPGSIRRGQTQAQVARID